MELFIGRIGDALQEGSGYKGEYGQAHEVGDKMKGFQRDLACFIGLRELSEEMASCRRYFFIDRGGDLHGIAPDLVEDKQREVGEFREKIDIGGHCASDPS